MVYISVVYSFPEMQTNYQKHSTDTPENAKLSLGEYIFTIVIAQILYKFFEKIDDLFDVKKKLIPAAARWKDIGLALRLHPGQLKKIEKENRGLDDCLTEMLTLWLKKNYNTERFGEPSWKLLAAAVGDPAGGNNPTFAEQISHGNHISQ